MFATDAVLYTKLYAVVYTCYRRISIIANIEIKGKHQRNFEIVSVIGAFPLPASLRVGFSCVMRNIVQLATVPII